MSHVYDGKSVSQDYMGKHTDTKSSVFLFAYVCFSDTVNNVVKSHNEGDVNMEIKIKLSKKNIETFVGKWE